MTDQQDSVTMSYAMEAEMVAPDGPIWAEVLDRIDPDFYHLPGYVMACGSHEGAEPWALVVREGERTLLVPLLERCLEDGTRDVTSPQGYPGFLAFADGDGGWVGAALRHGIERLRTRGIVSAYIRLHPLLNPEPPEGIETVARHPDTVSIDLSLSDEELWRQTRPRFRSQIRLAERSGHTFGIGADDARLAAFARLHRETMLRRRAGPAFLFEDAYFEALRATVGLGFHVATVDVDDRLAAAGLFIESAGIVHLHLAGSDPRYDRAHPMKLLYHRVRRWAKERGARWMHLGGGRGTEDDGLLQFKLGFSRLRTPYRTLRIVVDEERYRSAAARRFPSGVPAVAGEGFFPVYRTP